MRRVSKAPASSSLQRWRHIENFETRLIPGRVANLYIATMKLCQFIRPLDASFSTPKAARKLLNLFSIALITGAYAGAGGYLNGTLNDEVSLRRSYMNEAVSYAQNFFVAQQTLLHSLGLSTVRNVAALNSPKVMPGEEVYIQLGNVGQTWSLWLTHRLLKQLRNDNMNLLYVSPSLEGAIERFFTTGDAPYTTPASLMKRLQSADLDLSSTAGVWLLDPQTADSPLYLFTRLDERDASSGWLGLEVQHTDLRRALNHSDAGEYLLLDGDTGAMLSSGNGYPLRQLIAQMPAEQAFGFVGTGLIPEHLVLRKKLGSRAWQIVYAIETRSLLPTLFLPFLVCFIVCGLWTWLMVWLVRRINQRLIIPAGQRIEAVVESEAFSRAVIQIAPVALCVLRRESGEVVLQNSLAQQWLGAGEERRRLCHGWIRRGFEEVRRDHNDELTMADGRHLSLSFAPTRYKCEDVLICAFTDISARKQVEHALQQARHLADTANEAKSLFLATMSHEIRTPLYGVLGTLELLGRTALSHQQKTYLTAIEGSSANLLQLICDVLDVSRIEAGQLLLEPSRFSPQALIEDVIQSYAGTAHGKGLQLIANVDPNLPEWLNGDVKRIRQILSNLLNNALKFTDNGRIILRVWLDGRDHEHAVLYWQISDTGKGICHEDQQHLFEPFYQADSSTNVVAGTGLGLSICKRLIHLMDADIRVVSEPGLGSSFTLCLTLEELPSPSMPTPVRTLQAGVVYVLSPMRDLAESLCGWLRRWGARAQLGQPIPGTNLMGAVILEIHLGQVEQLLAPHWAGARVLAASDVHDGTYQGNSVISFNNLHELRRAIFRAQGQQYPLAHLPNEPQRFFNLGLHVLLVEDNAINQLIMRDQLEELGCTVTLASDGVAALALYRHFPFDLVLTDVNMPNMNGYELALQLRTLNDTLPIIGATANAMLEERERCLQAGMDRCLIKPFALSALYDCLQPYQRKSH